MSTCSSDHESFDYELHLLAMQMQYYQHRKLSFGEFWTIWTLLDADCYDVNAKDDLGVPPLVYAAKRGSIVLLWLLLRYHADINVLSKFQETALMAACRRRRRKAIVFLLKRGACPDGVDRSGYSTLRWAVEFADIKLLELLLAHGASVTKDCASPDSALERAEKSPVETHLAILVLLQQKLVEERRRFLQDIVSRQDQVDTQAKETTPRSKQEARLMQRMIRLKERRNVKWRKTLFEASQLQDQEPVVSTIIRTESEDATLPWIRVGDGRWRQPSKVSPRPKPQDVEWTLEDL